METSSSGMNQIVRISSRTAYQELNGHTIDIRCLGMYMMYTWSIGEMSYLFPRKSSYCFFFLVTTG